MIKFSHYNLDGSAKPMVIEFVIGGKIVAINENAAHYPRQGDVLYILGKYYMADVVTEYHQESKFEVSLVSK